MIDILTGVLVMTGISSLAALLLVAARQRYQPETSEIVQSINQQLPQTQCAQCGYPGCLPYAEAVAAGEAINLCPPGGDETVVALAELLGREAEPLNETPPPPAVAVIREDDCIGCTLCLPACPVDAIIGGPQQMHTVIAADCTGCELCLAPCPVDCIELAPLPVPEINHEFPEFEMNCINCGLCEVVCPRDLKPQLLFHERENAEKLAAHNLTACIECYKCDRVCPSDLPLTRTFKTAKHRDQRQTEIVASSERHQARFEAHNLRLASVTQKVRKRPSRGDKSALLAKLGDDV